ncbi:MAG: DUF1972 domain-containing protein [Actinomycetota bacterium]
MTGLRIAIIGSRGIPANYGGFETYVQELAPRLVDRGHEMTVYCRAGYTGNARPSSYKGVRLLYAPYLRIRALETLSHELTSIVGSLRRGYDLYYFLGTRSAPFYLLPRALGRLVVVHTDGLEWKRRKWSPLGRAYLRLAEWTAARLAADELVTDGETMRGYYRERYGRESTHLPYGAGTEETEAEPIGEWGLEPGGYYLVVCRIEPENNVDLIIREFLASGSRRTLVVVGGSSYGSRYGREIENLGRGGAVRLLGPVYENGQLWRLRRNAYAYIHGHEVGGTNPSLLEAMGAGNAAMALGTPFNRETLAGQGILWEKKPGSLTGRIRWADNNADEIESIGGRARERALKVFSWDRVAEDHDAFFKKVSSRRRPGG